MDVSQTTWMTRKPARPARFVVVCAIALTSIAHAGNADSQAGATLIDTTSGRFRGVIEDDVVAWKGVPYAAPPVGPLRWRPPQPFAALAETRDAGEFGHACPQTIPDSRPEWARKHLRSVGISEDCLTLNIWRPGKPADERLPVMVYFHGSAWKYASSGWPEWTGDDLASEGVIVVTPNYRLGLLGRFAHPALSRLQSDELLANYSLMDAIAALQWVNDNAEAIGGDPDRITIFGHSAGGVMVNFLMITPQSKGLFHRAIAQGSAVQLDCSRHLSQRGLPGAVYASMEDEGVEFARQAGLSGTSHEVVRALRSLPAETLIEYPPPDLLLNPVVDGKLVPDDIAKMFEQGRQHNVSYMTGVSNWEWSEIANVPLIAKWFIAGSLLEGLSEDDLAVFDDQWTRIGVSQRWFGEGLFIASTRRLAKEMQSVAAPAWHYHVTYLPESLRSTTPGAPHGMEVPYLFGHIWEEPAYHRPVEVELNDEDRRFGEIVRGYWLNFARTGNPNGPGLPDWPQFDAETDYTMELGPAAYARQALHKETSDFLEERALIRRSSHACASR